MLIGKILSNEHTDPATADRNVVMYDKFSTRKYKWRITFPDTDGSVSRWKQWDSINETARRLGLKYRVDIISNHYGHYSIKWNYIEFTTKRDMTMFVLAYKGPKGYCWQ